MAERRRNLIVTVAAGYNLEGLWPFLASWKENVSRSARLVIFTCKCATDVQQACRVLGITTIEISDAWRYTLLIDRHFVIQDYLRRQDPASLDAVMISDARDVIFQADPFALQRETAVSFAAEQSRIIDCMWNSLWVGACYGAETRDALGDNMIACAGTTIGTPQGVIDYLNLMRREFESRPREAAMICGDQGYHNYILHQLKPDFISLDREDRIVATLHHADGEALSVGDGVRLAGRRPAVVHQWDRHPAVKAHVLERYRLEPCERSGAGPPWAQVRRALARLARPGRGVRPPLRP